VLDARSSGKHCANWLARSSVSFNPEPQQADSVTVIVQAQQCAHKINATGIIKMIWLRSVLPHELKRKNFREQQEVNKWDACFKGQPSK
jgi:hypothetical protein